MSLLTEFARVTMRASSPLCRRSSESLTSRTGFPWQLVLDPQLLGSIPGRRLLGRRLISRSAMLERLLEAPNEEEQP